MLANNNTNYNSSNNYNNYKIINNKNNNNSIINITASTNFINNINNLFFFKYKCTATAAAIRVQATNCRNFTGIT